jgi:hypothetical protein
VRRNCLDYNLPPELVQPGSTTLVFHEFFKPVIGVGAMRAMATTRTSIHTPGKTSNLLHGQPWLF